MSDTISELLTYVDTAILWISIVVAITGLAFCMRQYRRAADPRQVLASRALGAILVLIGVVGIVLALTTDLFGD